MGIADASAVAESATSYTTVGQPVLRVDGLEKVTGRAEFIGDVTLPGMLWAAILRSPYPHARIRSIDATQARKLPGVVAVATAADTPKRLWGAFVRDMPILAIDKVRYVGEEVAA